MRPVSDFGRKLTKEEAIQAAVLRSQEARMRVQGHFPVIRTSEHIQREYNNDEYGPLLASGSTDPWHLFKMQAKSLLDRERLIISQRNEFYEVLPLDAFALYESVIQEVVLDYMHINPETTWAGEVCELGCGWGYFVGRMFGGVGGELTENGVALGQKVGYDVRKFNFYEKADYEIVPESSLVFTSHTIEQLPTARPVLEGLKSVRDRIACVIHFEPSFLPFRNDELGVIRNQYIKDHGYNTDLFQLLEQDPEIQIMEQIWDVIGVNPINPTNVCVWKFK